MTNLNCVDVRQILEADAALLDVRSTREPGSGCLPDAKNVPLAILPVLAHEHLETDEPVLIYCRSVDRTTMVGKILATPDFTVAVNVGGLNHYRHCH